MEIREDLRLAGWPTCFVKEVAIGEKSLSVTYLELNKSKKLFIYDYFNAKIEDIQYLGIELHNTLDPSRDGPRVFLYEHEYGSYSGCPFLPTIHGKMKGNPFTGTGDPSGYYYCGVTFESDTLSVVKLNKAEKFTVGSDVEKMPKFETLISSLSEFDKNLKYRGVKKSGHDIGNLIKVLHKFNLIDSNFSPSKSLSYHELRQHVLDHNLSNCLELPVEDIGTALDADKDYIFMLDQFAQMSNGNLEISRLKSKFNDGIVEIDFVIKKEEFHWEFEQDFDHLSGEFIDLVCSLQDHVANGGFLCFESYDCPQFLFVPQVVYDLFKHR
jgi:hypothetical protein